MIRGPFRYISEIRNLMREFFPYEVVIDDGESAMIGKPPSFTLNEPEDWCAANFGPCARPLRPDVDAMSEGKWVGIKVDTDAAWCYTRNYYGFKDPDMAFAFKMRFG
ncbi:MAG: hypothetical protein EOP83_09165 [Verrucomicrobiaceae bacterium]|nr:MAG: hypothetical protein EOP83_09165 [Verrucomicrobiaceae bacterium]